MRDFLCHRKLRPMTQKNAPWDAHSREKETCRKRPRSARECAKAHSFLQLFSLYFFPCFIIQIIYFIAQIL